MRKIYLFSFIIFLTLNSATNLNAQTKIWDGLTGDNWNDGANWLPPGVPGPTDDVLIGPFDGTIILDDAETIIRTLTIGGPFIDSDVEFIGSDANRILRMSCVGSGCESIINEGSSLICRGNASNRGVDLRFSGSPTFEIDGTLQFTALGGMTGNNSNMNFSNAVTTVNGRLEYYDDTGGAGTANATRLIIADGGIFAHAKNGGTIPTATWDPNSTLEVVGMTNNDPSFPSGIVFGNLVWNCPSQSADALINQNLTASDLTIMDTGAGSLVLRRGTGPLDRTWTINGDFFQSTGTTFNLSNNTGGGPGILNIKGSFISNGTINTAVGSNGTIIFSGNAAQTPAFDMVEEAVSVEIDNPNGVTLNSNLSINEDAELILSDGILTTSSSNLLTIQDGGTSDEGSPDSFVNGPIRKIGNEAFVFPTGKNGKWARIGISAPNPLAVNTFTAEYFNTPYVDVTTVGPNLDHVSKLEHWILDRDAGTSGVRATLYWEDDFESRITDGSTLVVARWDGSQWVSEGLSAFTDIGGETSGNVTSNDISSFSPCTFGTNEPFPSNPLPVTLVSFEANPINGQVQLDWVTASESNNDFFSIERSTDGRTFEEIGKVGGAGNSTETLSYQFLDKEPAKGDNYYRLRQVDFDGTFDYSPVRVVNINSGDLDITIFPNPAQGMVNLTIKNELAEGTTLSIIDQMGRMVSTYSLDNREQDQPISLNNLSAGIYTLRVTSGQQSWTQRLIVE